MPNDSELDRLKIAQDQAFQAMQLARRDQDSAWERRKSAQQALDRAYERKSDAHERQQAAWNDLQGVRARNGPRIDRLNDQQERAYQNMKDSFDRASNAHDARDGAAARSYADDGHRYKAESQDCVAERRQLVQEIREVGDRHKATQEPFQAAKREFDHVRAQHAHAKGDHERALDKYRASRDTFERAKKAFHDRLERVRDERDSRGRDKRWIAERAGVPVEYRDDTWLTVKPDGTMHIYFGGQGSPDGPGHGHYVMEPGGNVSYRRDPYEEHGSHNFTDSEGDYDSVIGAIVASGGEFGFNCEFRGYHAYVESNLNKKGREKIDIYYGLMGRLVLATITQ